MVLGLRTMFQKPRPLFFIVHRRPAVSPDITYHRIKQRTRYTAQHLATNIPHSVDTDLGFRLSAHRIGIGPGRCTGQHSLSPRHNSSLIVIERPPHSLSAWTIDERNLLRSRLMAHTDLRRPLHYMSYISGSYHLSARG